MVLAWYIETTAKDGQNDCGKPWRKWIDCKELNGRTGIFCWQLNPNTWEEDGSLNRIKEERGYKYDDILEISTTMPDFEANMTKFSTEHLHNEEEIRFVLDGMTYFDVRDAVTDDWIRIEVKRGDLLVLPAGIYHRLTLTNDKYVKLKRLFVDRPVWQSYERPAEEMECRQLYRQMMSQKNIQ